MRASCCLTLAVVAGLAPCLAQDLTPIALPKPQTEGGKPLMQALQERKSIREFTAEKLSQQTLSNLLWAAFGVNRPDGRRTAPSAMNRQEIEIYVALPEGVYLFEAKPHRLSPVIRGDLRGKTGTQPFVADAALNLVYVANYGNAKVDAGSAAADAGFIGQNVYLFCASEGLGTVFRGSVDRDALAKALNLPPDRRILYAQSVGYPKK